MEEKMIACVIAGKKVSQSNCQNCPIKDCPGKDNKKEV